MEAELVLRDRGSLDATADVKEGQGGSNSEERRWRREVGDDVPTGVTDPMCGAVSPSEEPGNL